MFSVATRFATLLWASMVAGPDWWLAGFFLERMDRMDEVPAAVELQLKQLLKITVSNDVARTILLQTCKGNTIEALTRAIQEFQEEFFEKNGEVIELEQMHERLDERLDELLAQGYMFPDPEQRNKAVAAAGHCKVTAVRRQCEVLAKEEAESLLAYLHADAALSKKRKRCDDSSSSEEDAGRVKSAVAISCVISKIKP
ncbi:MAG: hypothetical protein EB053_07050 [Chlamydiae bacterium]|nr:hypothetical protein [Chlamydiota bacterium]